MNNIWIIGGTTEGRQLAESLASNKILVYVSVVSEYGEKLLRKDRFLHVVTARMEQTEMEEFLDQNHIGLVLDASHPYAFKATEHARAACGSRNVEYIRIVRKELSSDERISDGLIWVETVQKAAEYLSGTEGIIFVTTGSKELGAFTSMPDYKERIYARVLPDAKVLEGCCQLGIPGKRLIAMQGPFSKEMNLAMFRQVNASWLVTKEAGAAGGFMEKLCAAKACGMSVVVIGRPVKEDGLSVEEAIELLCRTQIPLSRHVVFVGIGMGHVNQLTVEAADAIRGSDAVLGAPRLLNSLGSMLEGKAVYAAFQPEVILEWLDIHSEYRNICVLFSGDTGFYSGASKAVGVLEGSGRYEVTVLPGISSLSYLCSRRKISWEDVCICSLHGREADLEQRLEACGKVFVLLGGEDCVKKLLERLIKAGYDRVLVTVGERLSYADERISTGMPRQLLELTFDKLCAALIVNGEETS